MKCKARVYLGGSDSRGGHCATAHDCTSNASIKDADDVARCAKHSIRVRNFRSTLMSHMSRYDKMTDLDHKLIRDAIAKFKADFPVVI